MLSLIHEPSERNRIPTLTVVTILDTEVDFNCSSPMEEKMKAICLVLLLLCLLFPSNVNTALNNTWFLVLITCFHFHLWGGMGQNQNVSQNSLKWWVLLEDSQIWDYDTSTTYLKRYLCQTLQKKIAVVGCALASILTDKATFLQQEYRYHYH